VLRELNVPRVAVVGRHGTVLGLDVERGLYTANALANERLVLDTVAAQSPPVDTLILGLAQQQAMSITVLDALADLDRELAQRGVELHIAALPEAAAAVARRTPWFSRMAASHRVHDSIGAGLAAHGRGAEEGDGTAGIEDR
jgi:anti-anti-sigma regulatory factor